MPKVSQASSSEFSAQIDVWCHISGDVHHVDSPTCIQARQDAEQLTTALDLALADLADGTNTHAHSTNDQGAPLEEPQWRREKPIWDRMEMELTRQVCQSSPSVEHSLCLRDCTVKRVLLWSHGTHASHDWISASTRLWQGSPESHQGLQRGTHVRLQVGVHCHAQGSLLQLAFKNRDDRETKMEAELQALKAEAVEHVTSAATTKHRAMVSFQHLA